MAVVVIKSEPKCKLCRHVKRTDIDLLLEKRSNSEKDADGNRINLEYVLRVLGEWEVPNPTEENIKSHWRKHCQKVGSEALAQQATAVETVWADAKEATGPADVDAALDRMMQLGMAQIEARIAAGENPGIPPDLVVRIAAEKTKRRQNEATRDLLQVMAGGLAKALGGPHSPPQLGPGFEDGEAVEIEAGADVLDAEFTEVEA